MKILAKLIDKFSNILIQRGASEQWMKNIVQLRYKFLRHLYQEKQITHNLIVSITSYPPRFATLEYTLKSLLSQASRPREVVLWLYEEDAKLLPVNIRLLQGNEFKIKTTEKDYRSYKKIYPAIIDYQNDFILTADDDIFYNATWASQLLEHVHPNEGRILGHRAHRITLDEYGQIKPYTQWKWQIGGNRIHSGFDIFLTGGAGALYPPGSITIDDMNPENFLSLCESADDVWLYFMTTKKRYMPTKIPSDQLEYTWINSQNIALIHENVDNHKNDEYINKLSRTYGESWKATT